MSRPHAARSSRHAGLTAPAPTRAADAAHAVAPPLKADAHARFGHSLAQFTAFPDQDSAPIQREAEGGEEESDEMQMKAEGKAQARPDVPVAAGGGSPLPPPVRAQMERSLGHSFADVRVHSGSEAKAVGALAYTRGTDLHFQPGLYDPHTRRGQELLGHELAHVVQQSAGRVSSPQPKASGDAPINADPGLEAEADAAGAKAAQGQPARVGGAGSGVQRKADGPIQRDVIQREEDDEFKALNMGAAVNQGKFLPGGHKPGGHTPGGLPPGGLTPGQINALNAHQAGLLTERYSVRPTNNDAQRAADTGKVNAFRGRMAGEMATQKTKLADNDALPADVNSAKPTVKNPKGFSSFQTQQRIEREAELAALRDGASGAGPARTDAKGAALVNRLGVVPQTSGVFQREGAPPRPNNRPAHLPWNPARPPSETGTTAPSKYVTAGTAAGATPYKGGGGDKVVTRSGPNTSRLGFLENRLNNPQPNPSYVRRDYHGNVYRDHNNNTEHKFPREGLAARQQSVMKTAKKADPLMQDLDNPAKNNTLDHHRDKDQRTLADHWLRSTDRITNMAEHGRTLTDAAQKPYYAVGAQEFTNNQKLLPTLTGGHGAVSQANQNQSRRNVWSEADVTPTHVTSSWNHNRQANVGPRDGERLLHTHPNSLQATQDGKGRATTTASAPVDFRYQVTNDHYKSAVPVAPLQKDYKVNHPYTPSEMPPTPLAPGQFPVRPPMPLAPGEGPRTSRPLRPGESPSAPSSLNHQQALDRDDRRADAGAVAKIASDKHHAAQETRGLAEFTAMQNATSSAYAQAAQDAKQAGRRRVNKEDRRVNGAEFAEDQLSVQAGRDAERASARRDRDERDRVKWEGRGEDALPDKALADAQAASARREALEEARTQADLKALAPSEGVRAMYGMSNKTAQSVAEKQLEMQHQAALAWTGGDHIGDGPSTARRPMSADAESMYG